MNATQTAAATIAAPAVNVALISENDLIGRLFARSVETKGRGDVLNVEYKTDMLAKGKLRAAARKTFKNGLNRICRKTMQTSFDYEKVLARRSDGTEAPTGRPAWHTPLMIDGHFSSFSVKKSDESQIYLRYNLLTDAQKAAGFASSDFSRFEDNDGNEIDAASVAPFFFDREPQTVEFRCLKLSAIVRIKFGGQQYHISRA